MINLVTTSDLIRVNLSLAADLDAHVSGVDLDESSTPKGAFINTYRLNTKVTASGNTTIGAAPGTSNVRRNIKLITLTNIDTVDTPVVYVEHFDGTNGARLFTKGVTLGLGETLVLNDQGTWFKVDASGGVYMGQAAASDTVPGLAELAVQAEMEAAADLSRIVVPGRQHYHPGHPKFWARTTVSGGVPTLQQSYNITSITDTATGQLTVTIATDFSAVNYAIVTAVERSSTTTTVASARDDDIRNATPAVGSFIHECWDHAATNNALADPSTWYSAGLGDQ